MGKLKLLLNNIFVKNGIDSITKLINALKQLFTDSKGKYSSKRTISGVLVIVCASTIEKTGITPNALILALLAILPLCFSVFEKYDGCKCGE